MAIAPSRKAEIAAASILLLAAAAGFAAVPKLVAGWAFVMPGMTDTALSPSFFPRLALVCVGVTSLGVIVTASRRDDVIPLMMMKSEDWTRVILVTTLILAFFVGMTIVGFGLSAGLFIAAAGRLLGYERHGMLLATAVIAPVLVVLIFRYGLNVLLPSGILF